jgi:excisionase family DNA binding protein
MPWICASALIGTGEDGHSPRLQNMDPSPSVGSRVLSTSEAASELGVSERTLRRYITSGLIGFRRLPGGHYRIPREAIAEFWSEHTPPLRRNGRRAPLVAHPRTRAVREQAPGPSSRRPRLSASRKPRSYEVAPRNGPSANRY